MEKLKVLKSRSVAKMPKNFYENAYWKRKKLVCGVDEAGRGPLAGPVVAAAAMVPIGTSYRLLKDSKVMTEQERLRAFSWICKKGWYGVGIVQPNAIDRLNIWHATLRAMRRAVIQLLSTVPVQPEALLIDAMPLDMRGTVYADVPVHSFVYGERKSCSIAAASIVAKVTRDAIMKRIDPLFPAYALCQHKGYSTPLHKKRVSLYRPSIIHRMSYVPLKAEKRDNDEADQQQFC